MGKYMTFRLPIFVVFCLFASAVSAAPAAFSLIDGQNAYEVLGISRSTSDSEIRSVWAAKVKTVHTDITHGPDHAIKRYNAAYECVKPTVRADYEAWLANGGRRGPQQKPRARPRTVEEEIELTYNYILRASREGVADMKNRGEALTVEALASLGRLHVTYCLRYMPNTSFTPEQLADLIQHYALKLENDSAENRLGNFAAALGAITYLKELVHEDYYRAQAQSFIRRLRNELRSIVQRGPDNAYTRMVAKTYQHLTGESLMENHRTPQNCEKNLKPTVRVQGTDGRWYDVEIKLDIKFGN